MKTYLGDSAVSLATNCIPTGLAILLVPACIDLQIFRSSGAILEALLRKR